MAQHPHHPFTDHKCANHSTPRLRWLRLYFKTCFGLSAGLSADSNRVYPIVLYLVAEPRSRHVFCNVFLSPVLRRRFQGKLLLSSIRLRKKDAVHITVFSSLRGLACLGAGANRSVPRMKLWLVLTESLMFFLS